MADLRRNKPESAFGGPEIRMKPGMADELMKELAPLLAEDGIRLDDPDTLADTDTLNRALARAIERRNMALFTPVGRRREQAAGLLRQIVQAIADDDTKRAGLLLEKAQPESKGDRKPEVSACMGLALGLLDQWFTEAGTEIPADLPASTRLPAGHWFGERAATATLALARKGRASQSVSALIAKQGSHAMLAGSAIAVAAAVLAWSRIGQVPVSDLLRNIR